MARAATDSLAGLWFPVETCRTCGRQTSDASTRDRFTAPDSEVGTVVASVSTGLPELDDRLGGGLPAGSLVALTAPPDSQSEQLCYQFAAANGARYLSTFRPADEVSEVLDRRCPDASVPVVQTPAEALLESPGETLDGLPGDGTTLVLDTATELERAGRDRYRRTLDVLKRRMRDTDGLALLHCLDIEPSPMRRGLTLGRADVTLRLRLTGLPERLAPRLYVTKLRGGVLPDRTVPLQFGERVEAPE